MESELEKLMEDYTFEEIVQAINSLKNKKEELPQ